MKMQLFPIEVLLPCQIIGWFPLKTKTNLKMRELKFSLPWFVWGLVVTGTIVVLSCSALIVDLRGRLNALPDHMVTHTSTFTVLVDRVILCFLAIVVFISTVLKNQQFIDMYNSLQKIDTNLQITRRDNQFKYKVIIFLTLKTVTITCTIYYWFDIIFQNYRTYIPNSITYIVQATVIIFFINLCSVVKERFHFVNENLRKEVIKQSFGQLLRGVEGHGSFDFVPGGETSLVKIKRLTESYWLLCEFMSKANRCLSWHLFFSIVSLSTHTIISLFNLVTTIWPIVQHQHVPQMLLRCIWVIVNAAELLVVLRASSSITDVAHDTATMVCKLMNRNLGATLRKHLEVFLLSLRHQNAKFSALGLFQVQSYILTPIAGAVTTYLVILIQFQAQTLKQ